MSGTYLDKEREGEGNKSTKAQMRTQKFKAHVGCSAGCECEYGGELRGAGHSVR